MNTDYPIIIHHFRFYLLIIVFICNCFMMFLITDIPIICFTDILFFTALSNGNIVQFIDILVILLWDIFNHRKFDRFIIVIRTRRGCCLIYDSF